MAEPQITTWHDGRVAERGPIARPWSFVVALLGVVMLADLALGWLAGKGGLDRGFEPRDAAGLRQILAAAADDPDSPYLLVGDSVLAGDVMRGRIDGWEHRRVIDAMREATHPDSPARFHQVALDALLPIDVLHVVQELDAIDPGARVPVVVELNPRYFSRSYAELRTCTRPWLCDVGPTLVNTAGTTRWATLRRWLVGLGLGGVAEHVPLLRHRTWLRGDALQRAIAALVPAPPVEAPDALAARARHLAHYQELELGADSRQIQALAQLVARLRATGRRAVFFTTPLEDGFVAEAMTEAEYGHYTARMSELVDLSTAPQVELVHLDHPLFGAPLFLDHCHLGPEGNRRLAVNLLVELGVGLAQVPDDDALARPNAPDRTLVGRPDRGFTDGAAWQARFDHPRGLAVAPGGRRIVVADTQNHVLRELSGNLDTVRTLAGRAQTPGMRDAIRSDALLDHPTHPVILGRTVYFADQQGKQLRSVVGPNVRTVAMRGGAPWSRIAGMQADGDGLLILDAGRRILRVDPGTGRSRVVVDAAALHHIKAFAGTGDGRVFFADQDDRIWLARLDRPRAHLGPAPTELELEFPNTGADVVPQIKGLYFPLNYRRIRFANVVGMVWVERYGTLLVQDDVPVTRRIDGMTERIHLRMIDPRADLVYPWLKPLVHGGGYAYYNSQSRSFSSYFHVGTMALDQETATLFWLELNRSRLFSIADGVLGAAKVGHIRDLLAHGFRDLLGPWTATRMFERFDPQRFLDRRLERHPLAGPYQGLVIGSSMISKSDMIGSYSFGVRLEHRLRDALGYRDGIGFELYQRSYGGVPSEKLLLELRNMVDSGARLDVIFIELCGSRNRFFETGDSDARMREILADVDDIARRHDSLVVFFDDASLVSGPRDGNRGAPASERRFMEMARAAGFAVVTLGEDLMRDALELGPFGSPPYRSHHAAPWAVDEAADMLGDHVYPLLREHLRGRTPGFQRPEVDVVRDAAAIADVFEAVPARWATLLPTVTDASAQATLVGDELQIFVDLATLEVDTTDADALDDLAAGALYRFLVEDPAGARARRVHVQLAHFRRYDEYGAGVRDAAEIVRAHRLDRDALLEFLAAVRRRH